MRILLVAATDFEIAHLRGGLPGPHEIDLLVTGVGMVATAARCGQALARQRYDAAYNVGVCGSFDPELPPGTVVHVVEERLPELGVEDGERFIPIDEAGIPGQVSFVNAAPPGNAVLEQLRKVRGITVNTVHGHVPSIEAIVKRCRPQVESMEGAAFAYACAISDVPYAQVRAVSNVVERRNRAAWRLELAIRRLNDVALEILACP